MPREPIPRTAKTTKREPIDYTALVQPVFQPVTAISRKRRGKEAASASQQTKTAKPKKLSAKQRASKHTYAKMIARALVDLQERSGSSAVAIAKHIEANQGQNLPDHFKIFIRRALKKAVKERLLKHEGARYRLSTTGKYKLGLKKSTRKKSSKTTTKKRKASSKSSPKRRSLSSSPSPKKTVKGKEKDTRKSKGMSSPKKTTTTTTTTKKTGRGSRTSAKSKEVSSTPRIKATPAGFSFAWQYQEDGKWLPYDLPASDIVENAFQEYLSNPGKCDVRSVKSGQWQYQVDFLNNKQTVPPPPSDRCLSQTAHVPLRRTSNTRTIPPGLSVACHSENKAFDVIHPI